MSSLAAASILGLENKKRISANLRREFGVSTAMTRQTDITMHFTNETPLGARRAPLSHACNPKALLLFALLLCSWTALGSDVTNQPPRNNHGFSYFHDEVRDVPWSIHVLKIERARSDLELHSSMGRGTALGMALVSAQAKGLSAGLGKPLAAINGDFYHSNANYPGDPQGLQIVDGELVSAPNPTHVCVWIDAQGNPHRTNVTSQFKITWPDGTTTPFGLDEDRPSDAAVLYTAAVGQSTHTSGGLELILERTADGPWLPLRVGQNYSARVRGLRTDGDSPLTPGVMILSLGPKLSARAPKVAAGAVLQLSTATTPDLSGAKTAIGGGPTLVRGGSAMQWSGFQPRHPRTAIGWNKDYFFLVEVDGRQRSLSVGMTFPELATYMIKLGCEEAMNLDGGGSATMWVLGNVMNSPSEGHERPAANALVLVQKPKPQK